MKTKLTLTLCFIILPSSFILSAHAQGTAFTYQGRLNNNGTPANGSYDFRFVLFPTNNAGLAASTVLTNTAVPVTNGLFTTTLDFGAAIFAGASYWLDISVRTNGSGGFMNLSPRQPLTPTPYAVRAESANALPGLTIQPNTNGAPNMVGGSSLNFVSAGVVGATIGGGGATNYNDYYFANSVTADFGTVSGGDNNTASGSYATVGGGVGNFASGLDATVGGGFGNFASGLDTTVGGGSGNTASFDDATVGGGRNNTASYDDATVPGGYNNVASGAYSFAAGQQAHALHSGAFVWADSQNAAFSSTSSDQFLIRASGGVGIGTGAPETPLHIADHHGITLGTSAKSGGYTALRIDLSAATGGYAELQAIGAAGSSFGNLILQANAGNVGIGNIAPGQLLVVGTGGAYCNGTSWVNGSDRNSKEAFAAISPRAVLEKVSAMPITEWQYKVEAEGTKHIGPMAQDFHAAFGLNGSDDKHISTVDEGGVALAAIQGLDQKLEQKETEITELKTRLEKLEQIINQKNGDRQ